jgi:hypothetical protein
MAAGPEPGPGDVCTSLGAQNGALSPATVARVPEPERALMLPSSRAALANVTARRRRQYR